MPLHCAIWWKLVKNLNMTFSHLFDWKCPIVHSSMMFLYLLGVFWSIEGSNGHIAQRVSRSNHHQRAKQSNNNSSQITRIVISSSWWKQIPEGTNLNSRQRVALSSLTVSTSVPDSKTQWYGMYLMHTYLLKFLGLSTFLSIQFWVFGGM